MRRIAAVVFAVLLALPPMSNVWAQEVWPSRPITLISPYAPGGASDFLARTLTQIALWGPIVDKAGIQAE